MTIAKATSSKTKHKFCQNEVKSSFVVIKLNSSGSTKQIKPYTLNPLCSDLLLCGGQLVEQSLVFPQL